MRILCLNPGSSSLKAALYDDEIRVDATTVAGDDAMAALDDVLARFEAVDAVGHRVVHGGVEPRLVDERVLDELRARVPLAPLHLPTSIAAIERVRMRSPGRPQVVCFDTAFHADLPEVARSLPIPARFGLRRYGFHGLSYEYIVSALDPLPSRLVVAHLGHGASLAAISDGRSVDTTMGLTPSSGIPMSTRAGDLDPGVLLYLLETEKLDPAALARVVDRESGLVALGRSHDLRALLADEAGLAFRAFACAIAKTIGAYATVLGGLDAIVFTGGIGEHVPPLRAAVCERLGFLGVAIDREANLRSDAIISAHASRSAVRVIPTDEDRIVARHTTRVLAA